MYMHVYVVGMNKCLYMYFDPCSLLFVPSAAMTKFRGFLRPAPRRDPENQSPDQPNTKNQSPDQPDTIKPSHRSFIPPQGERL